MASRAFWTRKVDHRSRRSSPSCRYASSERFCKWLRSGRKQPDQNGCGLQNHLRKINGLAQNSIGCRYTIPTEPTDLTEVFPKFGNRDQKFCKPSELLRSYSRAGVRGLVLAGHQTKRLLAVGADLHLVAEAHVMIDVLARPADIVSDVVEVAALLCARRDAGTAETTDGRHPSGSRSIGLSQRGFVNLIGFAVSMAQFDAVIVRYSMIVLARSIKMIGDIAKRRPVAGSVTVQAWTTEGRQRVRPYLLQHCPSGPRSA